ncbi:hypothetical protein BDN67DRAFT_1011083 [Paxillus ammoniavirescens]|nr:hypothetical protein BDN67DRAFT_1011083 [Paxillus ammoniavirescens]
MARPLRCEIETDSLYDYHYSQYSLALPMPPGYPTKIPSPSKADTLDIAEEYSDLSMTYVGQRQHHGSQEEDLLDKGLGHQFGRQMSNNWPGYYCTSIKLLGPSQDTSSNLSSTHPAPLRSHTSQPPHSTSSAYTHTLQLYRDDGPQFDRENILTVLKREKQEKCLMESKVTKLEVKVASLEGQLSSSQKQYEQLLEKLPASSLGDNHPPASARSGGLDPFLSLLKYACDADAKPPAKHTDFPNVVYWTKSAYIEDSRQGHEYLKMTTTANSGSVAFLEDENGIVIDEDTQRRMREYQHALFFTLRCFNLAPTSWLCCTDVAREYFLRFMRTKFPIFSLCDDHWKADNFAMLYYSQWGDRPRTTTGSEVDNHVKQESDNPQGQTMHNAKVTGGSKRRTSDLDVSEPSRIKRKKCKSVPELNASGSAT